MTLDQIEMIEAVVELGSFQAAAKKLNKSQPSISVGIKKIEEFYDIELFSRAEYRPKLTPAGQLFFDHARKTLSSYRALDTVARELGIKKESQIRIHSDPLISLRRLEFIFSTVNTMSPHVPLSLKNEILYENVRALMRGDCEFAVGVIEDTKNPDLESIPFCKVNLTPLIHKSLVTGNDFEQALKIHPNIVVESTEKSTNSNAFRRWVVGSHEQKQRLILDGLGWGRLDLQSIPDKSQYKVIPEDLCSPLKVSMYFCRNKNLPLGPTAKKIWELVSQG